MKMFVPAAAVLAAALFAQGASAEPNEFHYYGPQFNSAQPHAGNPGVTKRYRMPVSLDRSAPKFDMGVVPAPKATSDRWTSNDNAG